MTDLIRKGDIPLDKSWIIRMGILDLINGYDTIINFLEKQEQLSDDLLALKRVLKNWNSNEALDVGESGTLYRFLKFASWKLSKSKKFIVHGTLKQRKIGDNPEIINWPLKKLLELDNKSSQWASASVLLGNKEKIENPPLKLQLTYKALEHWNQQRKNNQLWVPRYDKTIEKQALAFLDLLKTGKTNFQPEHSEDYCFARAFNLTTKQEAEKKFPSLIGHETNRIEEMENAIKKADDKGIVDSKDHRVVQAIAMRQKFLGKPVVIENKNAVNKTWPQFWGFLNDSEKLKGT